MEPLQRSPLPLMGEPFLDRLKDVAKDVESVLEEILPPPTTCLHQAMRYSVLGKGKRLRAFLVWATSHLFDVSPSRALKMGATIELIHAYSLVHDDLPCMDNADVRRGKPSCHKAFGESTAILVGDALIPLAFQTLSSLDVPPNIRLELITKLSQVIGSHGLVAGQMRDLGQEGSHHLFEDLLELQHLKTGVLFGFACEAGAILGKASLQEKNALRTYGLLVGEAFQMIDDWLDECGCEETTGKPLGQDTSKITFLSLLGPSGLLEKAQSSIQHAIEIISPFQERSNFLRNAAFFALNRER